MVDNIQEVLDFYQLLDFDYCIATDNQFAVVRVSHLLDKLHINCINHTLQLSLNEGFDAVKELKFKLQLHPFDGIVFIFLLKDYYILKKL
jgi:hypothetical protein